MRLYTKKTHFPRSCYGLQINQEFHSHIVSTDADAIVNAVHNVYSAVKIATSLADAFQTDIYLGPSLPAFISPNVLQYLVDTFNLTPISTPDEDLKTCIKQHL